jgi:hypothetical protein
VLIKRSSVRREVCGSRSKDRFIVEQSKDIRVVFGYKVRKEKEDMKMMLNNSIKLNEEISELVNTLEEEKKKLNLDKTAEEEDSYSKV